MQASHTRLDQVVLTLANLFRVYASPEYDSQVRAGIHRSLEKRWAKNADQEIFILAVFFNPYIRSGLFRQGNTAVVPLALFRMAREAFTRMFKREAGWYDTGFHRAFFEYLERCNDFSADAMNLDSFEKLHKIEVRVHHFAVYCVLTPIN